jgi:hypothetical protein
MIVLGSEKASHHQTMLDHPRFRNRTCYHHMVEHQNTLQAASPQVCELRSNTRASKRFLYHTFWYGTKSGATRARMCHEPSCIVLQIGTGQFHGTTDTFHLGNHTSQGPALQLDPLCVYRGRTTCQD